MGPLAARIVPAARLGTALGLMCVVQNAGIAGANLVAGRFNDTFGAGTMNAAGYQPMMPFFFSSGALGFALLLWSTAGRRHHEALAHDR